jgi:hypothetical protein
MTLLEILIAVTISVTVFAMIGAITVFTARSFVALGNYANLDSASRKALDTLSRDVRQARTVLSPFTSQTLKLMANDSNTVTYTYTPTTRKLTRQTNTGTTTLLEQCDFLNFHVYQRNPSNDWQWYPVQSNLLSTAKLIDVSWKCSRKILGQSVNTESVQTAKIVIRN